jgi:hypothetical protein
MSVSRPLAAQKEPSGPKEPVVPSKVIMKNGQSFEAESITDLGLFLRLHRAGSQIDVEAEAVKTIVRPPKPSDVTDEPPSLEPPVGAEWRGAQTVVTKSGKTAEQLLWEAAERHGLPPEFVLAVAKQESGFKPGARSYKGAMGLMQLMPDTARMLGADPRDPEQNVDAGVRFLRQLLLKYNQDGRKALAAYNAGPGAVDRYRGIPPYAETQNYVKRIITSYQKTTRRTSTKTNPSASN